MNIPTATRISGTFTALRFGTAGFSMTYHLKHEADRSWTLSGWRHGESFADGGYGESFEDGGYSTRKVATEAAAACFDREHSAWLAVR